MTENILKDPLFQFMMGLTSDELDIFMEDVIKRNDKKKSMLIKYARMLGNNLLTTMEIAVIMNDLLSVGLCIKFGVDINHTNMYGNSYVHLSSMKGHALLLESFIMKKVDVNKTNDDKYTALKLAMQNQNYNCVEVLINHGADLSFTIDGEKRSLIEVFLNIYEPKLKNLFELIVSKTSNIDNYTDNHYNNSDNDSDNDSDNSIDNNYYNYIDRDDSDDSNDDENDGDDESNNNILISPSKRLFFAIKKQMMLKNYDIIEIISIKFPKILNIVVLNHTLLQSLIELQQTAIINRLIKLDALNLNPQNMIIPYLHSLCSTNDIENIMYILEKNPNSIDQYCSNGRTVIDYVLLEYSKFSDEQCSSTIQLLINKSNRNILNHRNLLGHRTLETAIQFTNSNIVELLINNGCNINERIIDKSIYFPSITNNDPLAFASQFDKTDIIDTLFKYNVTINLSDGTSDRIYDGIPIAILSGIYSDSEKAIDKLMSYNQISYICNNEPIKQKILNFCVSKGTGNKKIMKYFIDPESLALLKINTDTLIFNKIESDLEQIIDVYQEDKLDCLFGMHSILLFLKYCSTFKSLGTKDNITILTEKFLCAISNDYFKILKNYIVQVYLKGFYVQEMNACFQTIENFIKTDDPAMITSFCDFMHIQTNYLHKLTDKITSLLNIIKKINTRECINIRRNKTI